MRYFNEKYHKNRYLTSATMINFLFGAALLIVVCINGLFYYQLSKYKYANQRVIHTYQVITEANESYLNVLTVESRIRAYAITGNKQLIKELDDKILSVFNHFNLLKNLTSDNPSQQHNVILLGPLLAKRMSMLQKIINEPDIFNNKSLQVNLVNQGAAVSEEIAALVQKIYNEELNLLNKRNNTLLYDSATTKLMFIVASILSIIIFLTGIIILNINMAKQRYFAKEKKKYENILKGIINETNDIIVSLDLNFRFVIFNRSFSHEFKDIFGKKPVKGMSIKEALAHIPEQQQKIVALWQRALRGEEFTVVGEFGDPHLQQNAYECNFSAIYNSAGKLVGASAITRNVEQRVEAENILKASKDKLQAAFQELKLRNDEIIALNEMASQLQSCNSIDETLKIIAIYCQKILTFATGVVYLINSSRNYLEIVTEWGTRENTDEAVFSPQDCWGLRQGKNYLYLNDEKSIICAHKRHNNKLPYLCVPLLAQNEVVGMLSLEFEADHHSDVEVKKLIKKHKLLINNLAAQLALAIANIRLRETLKKRSIRDPLTNLFNRAYLTESLDREIQRAHRSNYAIGMVIMDIDHFKRFNDTYGHDAGDLVLKEVSKLLQTQTRSSDIASRYGGEEFLIILIEIDMPQCLERVENIRKLISEMEIIFRGAQLETITASFGVSIYPKDGATPETLITAADHALYEAKKTGRNKIVVYDKALENAQLSVEESN